MSAQPAKPFRIRVFSDYICPWCYIGLKRLEQLREAFDIEVDWQPYELHPEIPPEGTPIQGVFGGTPRAAAYFENLQQYASGAGIDLRRPPVIANSHLALEAAEFARDHGRFEPYHLTLFHACFEEARDIGDPGVLCELAGNCGLDGEALAEALRSKRYASLVDQRTQEAHQQSISGTPSFIFDDRFTLLGAQEYRVFEDLAERMGAKRRT